MTRFKAEDLRTAADSAEVNGMPAYSAMLRQAADDCEDAERWREVSSYENIWVVLGENYGLPSEYDGCKSLNDSIDAARTQENSSEK